MKTLSKKIQEVLFGSCSVIEGGTPLRSKLSIPKLDGSWNYVYWEGNKGLIIYLIEKIDKLEKEVEEKLKTNKELNGKK